MKTKLNLLAAGLFLAAISAGFGHPVITQQPQSCTNVVGTTATFTVLATGTEPLAYQWQKLSTDWTDLADCTNAAIVLTNVQTSDAMDYRVVVTNADGAVISDVAHLTVLLPPTLRFSIASCTVVELAGNLSLTVWLLYDTNAPVSVDFATADGSAKAGLGYTATNGTLVFAAGVTNRTFTVPILNDGLVESNEYFQYFQVKLSNPTNAVLGSPAVATVYITDNDKGLHFYVPTVSVNEDAGEVKIKVARGDDGDTQVRVHYGTTDGTAKAGQDYTTTAGTLVFDPGEVLKSFTVPILNDALAEPAKTFTVYLSNPTGGAVLGTPAQATVTITDTDQVIQFDSVFFSKRP